MGETLEETRYCLSNVPHSGVTQDLLHSPSNICDNTCELLPTRELTRAFESRVFIRGWSCRHVDPPREKTDVHRK